MVTGFLSRRTRRKGQRALSNIWHTVLVMWISEWKGSRLYTRSIGKPSVCYSWWPFRRTISSLVDTIDSISLLTREESLNCVKEMRAPCAWLKLNIFLSLTYVFPSSRFLLYSHSRISNSNILFLCSPISRVYSFFRKGHARYFHSLGAIDR